MAAFFWTSLASHDIGGVSPALEKRAFSLSALWADVDGASWYGSRVFSARAYKKQRLDINAAWRGWRLARKVDVCARYRGGMAASVNNRDDQHRPRGAV